MFYTLAVVTFGTAVPAGQFVPGIMIGSTYGRLVGKFVVSFYKKPNIEEGTWVILILRMLYFNLYVIVRELENVWDLMILACHFSLPN